MAKLTAYNNIAGLNKALRKLPKEATVKLRTASMDIAADVAGEARDRAVRVAGVAKYVAPTIKATRDRVPVIRMGARTQLPSTSRSRSSSSQTVGDVIWGAEFGGQRREWKSRKESGTMQFQRWRGSSTGAGYFLWPAVRANSDDIRERYSQALLDALRAI
jgi:hypothetical protein